MLELRRIRVHYRTGALALALGFTSSAALAGAWTPPPGAAYHKFAVNYLRAEDQFAPRTPGFEHFTDFNFTYYGEKGIDDGVAALVSLPFKFQRNRENGEELDNAGPADVELGFRWRHLGGTHVLSTGYLIKLPFLYDENEALALGNGQTDVEFRVLYGRSLGARAYMGAEIAYRARFEAPSDEFRFLLEAGIQATSELYFRAKLDGIHAIGNGDLVAVGTGNPSLNLEFDLGRIELTAGYQFGKSWYGEFTATPALYGENSLDGTNYQLALIFAY